MTVKTWFYLHASVHIYIDGTRLRLSSALRVNALRNETENLAILGV